MKTIGITSTPDASTPTEAFSATPPHSSNSFSCQESLPDLRKKTSLFVVALGLAGLMWLLVAIPVLSDAGDGGLLQLALIGSGALLGALWFGAVCYFLAELHSWKAKAWMAIVPLAGLLGLVLASTDVDLALRVWLCESALTRYAAVTPPHYTPGGERVGLFRIDELNTSQGAFALYTSKEGLMNRAGIAYVPPGSQPPPGIRIKGHLYGNWYSFWWKF